MHFYEIQKILFIDNDNVKRLSCHQLKNFIFGCQIFLKLTAFKTIKAHFLIKLTEFY